jgi:hypothetical protein
MKNFILYNFLVFIVYTFFEYIATKLHFLNGNLLEDINTIVIILIVSMVIGTILLNKIKDYI